MTDTTTTSDPTDNTLAGSATGSTPTPDSAPTTGSGTQTAKQTPSLGRIVMVRQPGRTDAPAIIVEVDAHTGHIGCQVFRGDHTAHSSMGLSEIDSGAPATAPNVRGWYWPERK